MIFSRHWMTLVLVIAVRLLHGEDGLVDFQSDIRPILSNHCFACHGPDEADRQADLRLDTAEGIREAVESVVPDRSPIWHRIHADDPDLVMPPPEYDKPLTAHQKRLLNRWLQEGADVTEHWAFVPPRRSKLPDGFDMPGQDRIDGWIDSAIARAGLTATDTVDRRTLARRVALDLTGLPPTPNQVQIFLDDEAPDSLSRYVDGLLGDSAYGEHMARYWLDLVRYADTHGLHFDNYREIWPYRDWVIESFNANMPMDEFITWQLAGDLLPDATLSQQIASGFNRLNLTTNEGGSIYEEVFVRNVIDRTDAFGTVFLGLTTGCAVCHDHKYDPISQVDYYSLSAFFNSLDGRALDLNQKSHPPVVQVPDETQREERDELAVELSRLARTLEGELPEADAAQSRWEQTFLDRAIPDSTEVTIDATHVIGPFEVENANRGYGKAFAGEDQTDVDFEEIVQSGDRRYRWQSLASVWPGESASLPTTTDRASVSVLHQQWNCLQEQSVTLLLGCDDGCVVFLNGKEVRRSKGASEHRFLDEELTLELKSGRNDLFIRHVNHAGEAQWSFSSRAPDVLLPTKMVQAIATPDRRRTEFQRDTLRRYYRYTWCDTDDWSFARTTQRGVRKLQDELDESIPTTLVWKETKQPRSAHVLRRGQYDSPGAKVARDTPSFLPKMTPSDPRDRLGLAGWLTRPGHPLTARVMVNRLWQQVYGVGLVETSEDFGSQGTPPSHPELLDELALDLIESGWDVKAMMKRLVLTRAYRRSPATSDGERRLDPANRWLARGTRHRLDAEVIRDQALALSGLLIRRIGGPSVRPPQPPGLWAAVGYTGSDTARFEADQGEKIHRRSLYTFWKRTSAPAAMTTLDAPSRESCTARRGRTNTPLQALLMMNEPQMMAASLALAEMVVGLDDDVDERLEFLFGRVMLRMPEAVERRVLKSMLADLVDQYASDLETANQLTNQRDATLAAWTVVASTLINTDEVMCR
ncbi:MAG: PSD1 and planctomycete cytochrome C domain-containing protein [Planctomycetota bacterium]